MKKAYRLLAVALTLGLVGCQNNGNAQSSAEVFEYQTLQKSELKDKILGSWIGQAIGLGSGFEYVTTASNVVDATGGAVDGHIVDGKTAIIALSDSYWEPDGQICSGSIGVNPLGVHPVNDPRVIHDNVYSDDDMHVDVLNQFIFRDYGPRLGPNDIASAWRFYDVHDAGGGADAANTMKNSAYLPPYTGQSAYGCMGYWVTESWIENDSLGILFPYLYDLALGYGDMFTQVQGDAYGYLLGRICALAYSLAYEYSDCRVILDKCFEAIGKSNDIYSTYQYVLKCYDQGVSWRQACIGIVEQAVNCAKIGIADTAGFSITANAGMIFLGLIYGNGDFEQAIKISSLCGLDGDCTTATVGGLMGLIKGYSGLPEKYQKFMTPKSNYYNYTGANSEACGVSWGAFAYCGKNFPNRLSFDQLSDITLANVIALAKSYHGSEDETTVTIAKQPLKSVSQVAVDNYSFENGTTEGWEFEAADKETTFSASSAATHLGKFGGSLILANGTTTAKVYRKLSLEKGHTYRANIWINGCNDREVRFYAQGSSLAYRSFVNPLTLSNRHMKAELCFTADQSEVKVGLDFGATYADAYSTTVGIDDFWIEDINADQSAKTVQSFEAEKAAMSGSTVREVKDQRYSSSSAVELGSDDAVSFTFEGADALQSFHVYYENKPIGLATFALKVDDKMVANLPVVSTGENGVYNASNYADFDLYLGAGKHTLSLTYTSFDTAIIDKLVIGSASRFLED